MSVRNIMYAANMAKRSLLSFIGEIPEGELILRSTFEQVIGITDVAAGSTLLYAGTNAWLKFMVNGKELLIAKKPFRSNLSYNAMNTADVIDGNKVIEILGKTYKVRLPTGSDGAIIPADGGGRGPVDCEWDNLILRIHETYDPATRWATYSNEDLGLTSLANTGGVTVCKDRRTDPSGLITRGWPAPTGTWYMTYDATNYNYGWRPVLEEV